MSVYTVHEPPSRYGDSAPDVERFVFVRDGFYFWAFVLAPLWLLWHRLWLALLGYIVISGVLEGLVAAMGASGLVISVVGLLIALLVGFEAATLRRAKLRRRGFRTIGVVSGTGLEAAERRFFQSWVQQMPRSIPPAASPQPPVPTPAPTAPVPQPPHIIGLFPEPGGSR